MLTSRKIYIEGGLGVGKSTLLSLLETEPRFRVLPEPLTSWTYLSGYNLLEEAYRRGKGENHPPALMRLQVQIIATLHRREREARKLLDEKSDCYAVLERSPESALVFIETARPVLEGRDEAVLRSLLAALRPCFGGGGLKIFLTATPSEILRRVNGRRRSEEREVEQDYLLQVDREMCEWSRRIQAPLIDTTDLEPREVLAEVKRCIAEHCYPICHHCISMEAHRSKHK